MVKKYEEQFCVCKGIGKTQRHHLFRGIIRRVWKKLQVTKIPVYWVREDGTEVCHYIPINAYIKLCDECHMTAHPENISHHLNRLVVASIKEKELNILQNERN